LRRLCDEHGIVLIADEVQGGMARTGKMFSIEHSGVIPDLITVAKGLGGGFPLSGVTGRATIMDAAHAGGLGGTYGGNPISIAAAHAVLDVIEAEGLCARAASVGDKMRARLQALARMPCTAMSGRARCWHSIWSSPKTKTRMQLAAACSLMCDAAILLPAARRGECGGCSPRPSRCHRRGPGSAARWAMRGGSQRRGLTAALKQRLKVAW
jgi:hypothetical protein